MAGANPALSYAKIFSTFMHTIPPEHFQNQGRVAIVKHFKWRRVHAHHTTRAFSKPGKSGDRETFQMEKSGHTAREYRHLPRIFQRFGQKVEKDWDIDFYRQR